MVPFGEVRAEIVGLFGVFAAGVGVVGVVGFEGSSLADTNKQENAIRRAVVNGVEVWFTKGRMGLMSLRSGESPA